jgi:hypothetical protein
MSSSWLMQREISSARFIKNNIRAEVFTVVSIQCDLLGCDTVTPFRVTGGYQHFGGTYCLHLQCPTVLKF